VAVQPSSELVVRGDTDGPIVAPDVTRFDRPDYTPHGPSPRAIARPGAPGEEPPNQQSEEPLLT